MSVGQIMKEISQRRRFKGTTSGVVDQAALNKLVMPDSFKGCNRVVFYEGPQGEGVYLEDGDGGGDRGRAGFNCPADEVTAEAGQITNSKIINMSDNVWVAVYDDGGDSTKLKAVVITKSGSTLTAGTPTSINAAATNGVDAKRLSATTFVVAYADNGGDDYLCARIGTVTASNQSVAFGTEKALTAAAIDVTDEFTVACAVPRSGVIAFAYQLASDSKGYILASTYTGTTIATPGTAVEFEAGECHNFSMEAIATGRVVIGYQDDGNSDYLTTCVCTVSAAGVCVAGTSETHTTAAATSIEVHKAEENRGILTWIDTGDLHILAFDIGTSGTTLAEGADATLAGTHLTASSTMWDNTNGVIAYEDDANSDYGTLQPFSIAWAAIGSGGVVTLSSDLDYFAEASTQTVHVAANSLAEIVVLFDDAGDSDATKIIYGAYHDEGIFDIRSSGTSATWTATIYPERDNPNSITDLT